MGPSPIQQLFLKKRNSPHQRSTTVITFLETHQFCEKTSSHYFPQYPRTNNIFHISSKPFSVIKNALLPIEIITRGIKIALLRIKISFPRNKICFCREKIIFYQVEITFAALKPAFAESKPTFTISKLLEAKINSQRTKITCREIAQNFAKPLDSRH